MGNVNVVFIQLRIYCGMTVSDKTGKRTRMTDTLQHALCLYKRLENGAHKFTFREASPAAVDEWCEIMRAIAELTLEDEVVRLLIVNRPTDALPTNHILQRSRELLAQFPERASIRTAVLYDPGELGALAESFARLIRSEQRDKVRFFPTDAQDEALAWLLADD